MTADEKKLIKGFMFLSQKPILYVLNIGESTTLGDDLEAAVAKFGLAEVGLAVPTPAPPPSAAKSRPSSRRWTTKRPPSSWAATACTESGLVRLIRKSYELLGLISFFTAGEDECRAWTFPRSKPPQEAAGAIHSDLEKHFIRAETIRWDTCSPPAPKPPPAPKARCAWKARTTWCRTAM
jgi:ribosome-binding ATPase YchF (GTP1/OBG family)